eukprot:NODE_189_length_13483_cov_0.581067.p1 type:complete len:304 gc:universal NODE_189_length_13483_cov_0.581067:917-6(-)
MLNFYQLLNRSKYTITVRILKYIISAVFLPPRFESDPGIMDNFDNEFVRRSDMVFGDLNCDFIRNDFRNDFMRAVILNNHFQVPSIGRITRLGRGSQQNTSNDHVLIKEDLPFIKSIEELITFTQESFDHMLCYIDIQLTPPDQFATDVPIKRWSTNYLNNPQYKHKYEMAAQFVMDTLFRNQFSNVNQDIQDIDTYYSNITNAIDSLFDNFYKFKVPYSYTKLNLANSCGIDTSDNAPRTELRTSVRFSHPAQFWKSLRVSTGFIQKNWGWWVGHNIPKNIGLRRGVLLNNKEIGNWKGWGG